MPGLLALINPNEFLLCITRAPTESVQDPSATCIIRESFTELISQQFISIILSDPEDLCK